MILGFSYFFICMGKIRLKYKILENFTMPFFQILIFYPPQLNIFLKPPPILLMLGAKEFNWGAERIFSRFARVKLKGPQLAQKIPCTLLTVFINTYKIILNILWYIYCITYISKKRRHCDAAIGTKDRVRECAVLDMLRI